MNYQRVNVITGWVVFLLATLVYVLTCEPTISFWDCGEFVPCAYKLEVSHAPGTPLFALLGHLFTMFGPTLNKAVMVNYYSAVVSGLGIMFLFWITTHFARRIFIKDKGEMTMADSIAVIGAGLIAAGAGTFVDSYWFSAVEGIVWSSAAFFTSAIVWSLVKWDNAATEKYGDRWLILIFFLIGLSIGVHLLSLLTIPMVIFMYYFRRFDVTPRRTLITLLLAVAALGVVQYGIIQYLVIAASYFELLFVNEFALPFNSGFLFFILFVVAALIFGISYAHKNNRHWLQLGLMACLMIIIGYSSYTMTVLRASANVSVNMGDPSDPFSLRAYLARDQYGSPPFLYGHIFTAQVIKEEEGAPMYHKNEKTHKYDVVGHKPELTYDEEDQMFFPRVWDGDESNHARFYKQWLGLEDKEKPTFGDNLKFFLGYQVYYMYWRYFLWDFAGRQNDLQGGGNSDIRGGNWITGINFIDNYFLGKQDNLPHLLQNRARNRYFMLPLILGLIGVFYHYRRSKHDWWLVFMLFFMMGMAILIYLNQTPEQPRERDYSYACSTYAFCIWIGIGVLSVYNWLKNRMQGQQAALAATGICAIVPFIMGQQGWDDHDRSHRFTAHDMGVDYLESCAPNAILFTQGDNDTYPLWYCQEVEHIRPDVRVINLALVGVDWYIDNLRRKQNESDIVEMTLGAEKEVGDNRNFVIYNPDNKNDATKFYDLKKVIEQIGSDNPKDKVPLQNGSSVNYFTTMKFKLPVDRQYWTSQGILNAGDSTNFPEEMMWEMPSRKKTLLKNDLVMLDIIANNINKRPIYLPEGGAAETALGLGDYLQLEGLTMRLTPLKRPVRDEFGNTGAVNSKMMYDNVMHKFKWGGIDKYNVYLDENISRMVGNLHSTFGRLSTQLMNEGEKDKSVEVMDHCMEVLPFRTVPVDPSLLPFVENYYKAGQKEKAEKLAQKLVTEYSDLLAYIKELRPEFYPDYARDINMGMYTLNYLTENTKKYGNEELSKTIKTKFDTYFPLYQSIQSNRGQ